MKNLALILAFIPFACAAQTKKPKVTYNLKNVKELIKDNAVYTSSWALEASGNKVVVFTPNSVDELMSDMESFVVNDSFYKKREPQQNELICKYNGELKKMMGQMAETGGDPSQFYYIRHTTLPVQFGLYNDTALSLMVGAIKMSSVYNTLKLDAKERAAKTLESHILVHLKAFKGIPDNVKYVGMTCVYGCRDFSTESSITTNKSEYVSIVMPRKTALQYANGDITAEDVFQASDIYLSDIDMEKKEIKKIKL